MRHDGTVARWLGASGVWLAPAAVGMLLAIGCGNSNPRTGSGAGGGSVPSGSGGASSGSGGLASGVGGSAAGQGGAGVGGSSAGTGGASGAGGAADAGGTAGGTAGGPGADAGTRSDAANTAPAVERAATLEILRRVADYELTRFGAATNANWVRAVFYTGLLALYRADGDAKYLAANQSWGQANNWRLGTDSGNNPRWADNQTCAQTYADLYLMNPVSINDVMLSTARSAFDQMVAAPMAGRVEWWWEDALFMAPPALARVAKATPAKSAAYLNLLHSMWWDTKAYLFSDADQLMWRDNSYRNTSFWSRGNGWVVAGIARLLDALPVNDARRPDYEALLRLMAGKLRTIQAADGFWRSDLLNPTRFPTPESSGTAFFCYGIAWGIHHGVLDRATYLDSALRAWSALGTAVSAAGRLGWVQAVGAQPGPSNQNDTNDYATGAFLLAGTELLQL